KTYPGTTITKVQHFRNLPRDIKHGLAIIQKLFLPIRSTEIAKIASSARQKGFVLVALRSGVHQKKKQLCNDIKKSLMLRNVTPSKANSEKVSATTGWGLF